MWVKAAGSGSASEYHSLSANTTVTNIVSVLYGNFLSVPLYAQIVDTDTGEVKSDLQ